MNNNTKSNKRRRQKKDVLFFLTGVVVYNIKHIWAPISFYRLYPREELETTTQYIWNFENRNPKTNEIVAAIYVNKLNNKLKFNKNKQGHS